MERQARVGDRESLVLSLLSLFAPSIPSPSLFLFTVSYSSLRPDVYGLTDDQYKKKSPRNLEVDPSTGIAPLSMDALVHSSPIVGLGSPGKKRPQGPRIEKYFLPPPQSGGTVVSGIGLKRRRESVSVAMDSATKRMRTQFDAFASMGGASMGNTPVGSTPGGP